MSGQLILPEFHQREKTAATTKIEDHISVFAVKMSHLLGEVSQAYLEDGFDDESIIMLESHINDQIAGYRANRIPLKPFEGVKLKSCKISLKDPFTVHVGWETETDLNFYKKTGIEDYSPLGFHEGADLYVKGNILRARHSNDPVKDEVTVAAAIGEDYRNKFLLEAKMRAMILGFEFGPNAVHEEGVVQ